MDVNLFETVKRGKSVKREDEAVKRDVNLRNEDAISHFPFPISHFTFFSS